jgi:hypothetical protein
MRDLAPSPPDRSARRQSDRRTYVRALAVALVASAAIHLAILHLISFPVDVEPARATPPPVSLPERAMRAYDVAEVAAAVAPIEVQLEQRQREREIPAAALPWGVVTPPAEVEGAPGRDPGTVTRDPLRYRMGAREVWRPQSPLPPEELSPDERVRARVAAQLKEYNDSIAAEEAARANALDWTTRTASGGRWGVSPEGVHLGSITLPRWLVPTPAVSPEKRAEFAGRERNWAELQRQAERIEIREVFDDRVRAIRERNEQERARQNSVTGSGPGGTGTTGGPPPAGGSPPGGGGTTGGD